MPYTSEIGPLYSSFLTTFFSSSQEKIRRQKIGKRKQ
jgi:hypothetical protein